MKKLVITILFTVLPAIAFADIKIEYDSHGKVVSQEAPIDIFDKESIKRGAKHFANYCLSCHSAKFMRFNRIAKDTGMTDGELRESMIFTRDNKGKPTKLGNLMEVSMSDDYAKNAFGGAVPDLSLTARSRGADWLYTYLRTFYIDPYRPTGMNNVQFSDVGMPHVLWELQGTQKAVYATEEHGGVEVEHISHLETVQAGSMTAEEYDAFTTDLVNFMVYIAEPIQAERRSMGWKVLLFLAVFFVFAYLLKKEYWKDVH
jgi:ubiquinol-cytochrome c reductase cytochrome c1 subunit